MSLEASLRQTLEKLAGIEEDKAAAVEALLETLFAIVDKLELVIELPRGEGEEKSVDYAITRLENLVDEVAEQMS
jgi:hypothetical protein